LQVGDGNVELAEEDVRRYSRQILLRQVGASGQRVLLEAQVEVTGKGEAVATAAAYLAASGVKVVEGGGARLCEAPAPVERWEEGAPVVVLGSLGDRPSVLFRAGRGCASCFFEWAVRLSAPPRGLFSVELGAMGALALQRCLLDPGATLAGLCLRHDGSWEAMEMKSCAHCP
jgi:hypothetical protein